MLAIFIKWVYSNHKKDCSEMLTIFPERELEMQKITQKFIENTSIDTNEDVIRVFEFIASPDSVQKMITSTENGKPALAGIVHELEERYADCEGFPLNHEGPDKNVKNRRNVGWMIMFVMREYGYTPIDNSE